MFRNPPILGAALAVALLALVTRPAAADDPAPAEEPPDAAVLLDRLQGLFKAWDLNKDGVLDKDELAKAFRGKDALPFEEKPGDKEKPDHAKFPDLAFLLEADTNGDGKVSEEEFNAWAKSYAPRLKEQLDTEFRALKAQARLERTVVQKEVKGAEKEVKDAEKEMKAVEKELKKEQAALKKMESQMKAYERHLRQQLHHARGSHHR